MLAANAAKILIEKLAKKGILSRSFKMEVGFECLFEDLKNNQLSCPDKSGDW